MKFGVFGDLHGANPKEIVESLNSEKVTAIFANGDFISCNNKDLEKIIEQIVSNSNSKVFVIPGNYENPNEWKLVLSRLTKEYENLIDNNRKKYQLGELNIVSYGGGTVRPYCEQEIFSINPIQEVSELTTLMDENTILQLHEPPKYYGDTACAYIEGNRIIPLPCESPFANKYNVGNEWITYLIEGEFGIAPKFVVGGHIHESRTSMEIGSREETKEANRLYLNPGAAANGYYAIAEVGDTIRVKLLRIK